MPSLILKLHDHFFNTVVTWSAAGQTDQRNSREKKEKKKTTFPQDKWTGDLDKV